MKKYIVLSVNDNPDYLYYTPLTCWAWRKFGWEPVIMLHTERSMTAVDTLVWSNDNVRTVRMCLLNMQDCRSDTLTQMSRLYAACVQDGYLMTGDIDMLPLSDYWKPEHEHVPTVWGHDLTGFGHYPICYIGMPSEGWKRVMKLYPQNYNDCIERDLKELPQALDPDFYKYWFTDQDLITKRLKTYAPVIINRGQYSNGYAVGRVDRGAWSLNHSQFIDAHLFQQLYHKNNQDKFDKTMELLTSIWPDEDFQWFIDYTNEFRKLTGHA